MSQKAASNKPNKVVLRCLVWWQCYRAKQLAICVHLGSSALRFERLSQNFLIFIRYWQCWNGHFFTFQNKILGVTTSLIRSYVMLLRKAHLKSNSCLSQNLHNSTQQNKSHSTTQRNVCHDLRKAHPEHKTTKKHNT